MPKQRSKEVEGNNHESREEHFFKTTIQWAGLKMC